MAAQFDIETFAQDYIVKRFPRATESEHKKWVRDWTHKMHNARGTVKDFEARVGSLSDLKVLDVGSGPGGLTIAFAEKAAEAHGVDIEKDLIDISKAFATGLGSKAQFSLYDGGKLPFNEATFDAAISISVLEHVSDPTLHIQEILRVLKPGGVLYLAFPNRAWPKETHMGLWGITYLPRKIMPPIIAFFKRNPLEDHNLHFYTYWNAKKFIKAASVSGSDAKSMYRFEIQPEYGNAHSFSKKAVKGALKVFGIPHKAVLPHVMLIVRKKARTA